MGSIEEQSTTPKVPYNCYFVPLDDMKWLPPYFQNVSETPKEVSCLTKGLWPTWLKGTFMRVGAGKFVIPLSEDGSKPPAILQHFFDGLAMLHKFTFENGHVRYMSRYTTEGIVRKALKDGFLQINTFGLNPNTPLIDAQDPCYALLGKQKSAFVPGDYLEPDVVNVNVVPRRGMHLPQDRNPLSRGQASEAPEKEEVLISTDYNMLQVCDAATLAPKRLLTYADIDEELSGFGICAHPPKDRKRGVQYNYIISMEGVLNVFALDHKANPVKMLWKTPLPCPPCYIHSLAMTQDYVVFIRNPICVNASDPSMPLGEALEYEEGVTTKFFVLRKSDGKHIATYEKANFMFFHSVNGYDYTDEATGDVNLHIDLCSYAGSSIPYREYHLSNIINPAAPYQDGTLVRYELSAINKAHPAKMERATVAQAIPGAAMELPRIRKDRSMVPSYRYVYACGGNAGASPGTGVPIGRLGDGLKTVHAAFFSCIAKTDWLTGTFIKWQPKDGESCPCEPVFVARPGSTEEDDGVVLTIVIDRKGTKSILVALNGKDLKEVSRADMPQVYGLGPHGSFIEGEGL